MTEASHKEYAFLQRKCLDPMQDKYMPKKPSAAFKKGMKAAELEQQDIDEVLDVSINTTVSSPQPVIHLSSLFFGRNCS